MKPSSFIDQVQGAGLSLSLIGLVILVGCCLAGLEHLAGEVFGATIFLGGLILTCAAAIIEAIKKAREPLPDLPAAPPTDKPATPTTPFGM